MTTDPKHEEKLQTRRFHEGAWDALEDIHTKLVRLQVTAASRHEDALALTLARALDEVVKAKGMVA